MNDQAAATAGAVGGGFMFVMFVLAIFLIFLPVIFLPILAFGSATYTPAPPALA